MADVSPLTSSTGRENHLFDRTVHESIANQNIMSTGRNESSRPANHQAGAEFRSRTPNLLSREELQKIPARTKVRATNSTKIRGGKGGKNNNS